VCVCVDKRSDVSLMWLILCLNSARFNESAMTLTKLLVYTSAFGDGRYS